MIEPTDRTLPDSPAQARLDQVELAILRRTVPVELPVEHRFTPGLYLRTIFMPAGTLLTSKIHRTAHPFVVHRGRALVFIEGVGVEEIAAPYLGVTLPGTRRLLYIVEDCEWTTFHPITEDEHERVDAIEDRIIERRELPGGVTANELHRAALAAFQEHGIELLSEGERDTEGTAPAADPAEGA